MSRKACPVLKFEITALTPNGYVPVKKHKLPPGATGVRIYSDQADLSLSVETVTSAHPLAKAIKANDFLQPGWVSVDARHRRCGVGTALYQEAAKLAKASKLPLVSSRERSEMSEGFWSKQAKKGRATCLPNAPGAYSARGRYDDEQGRVNWSDEAWPCWRYVLKRGKTDLSGPKKRRR